MCGICGCGGKHVDEHEHEHVHDYDHNHVHVHVHERGHGHGHVHVHGRGDAREILERAREAKVRRLEAEVLDKNARIAQEVRGWFEERGILALNLVSSPGSGKTTLLERTLTDGQLGAELLVIQGDQATSRDAERVRRAGARAVQINTGTGCHLDASMVQRALTDLEPAPGSIVAIENVGNLVCPALFDLGESRRVAVISTTEGADKPLKYPHMFRSSQLILINKLDLAPYVDFDLSECLAALRQVNPDARVLMVSARTGAGLPELYALLRTELGSRASTPAKAPLVSRS